MRTMTMAIKNLDRQKKRSLLLGGAIALGIFVVTLVSAAAGGFLRNVGDNYARLLAGQIFVQGVEKTATGKKTQIIRDPGSLEAAIGESGLRIESVVRSSGFPGTFVSGKGSVEQQIVGVDAGGPSPLERLAVVEGSTDAMRDPSTAGGTGRRDIVISRKVADKLGVGAGSAVVVRLRTRSGQENAGDFRVAAVYRDPGVSSSFAAYANLSYVNELMGLGADQCQTLGVMLARGANVDETAAALYGVLGKRVSLFAPGLEGGRRDPLRAMLQQHQQNPMAAMYQSLARKAGEDEWTGVRYRIYTLNDLLAQVQLPQLIGAVQAIAVLVLVVLLVIVMAGIANTFRVVMIERTREIGTMRALGLRRERVRDLFLAEALALAIGGIALGLGLAAAVMGAVGLLDFGTSGMFSILLDAGRATFVLPPALVAAISVIVAVLTLAAAYFPARAASRLDPAKALASRS